MLGARLENTEGTGERVGGYRVVRRLATGGTCDVLLATAEGAARAVVLKVLRAEGATDPRRVATFEAEAGAYARLSHSSIVGLLDFFTSSGRFVMVFEDVEGPQLDRLRGMLKSVGRQIDDRAALHVAASLFAALAVAHGAQGPGGESLSVIHRDVNPSNVLVTWDGQVKLSDFAIASVTGVGQQRSAGLIKGTYGYIAPEQVKGELVTSRADVYAAAIILWELLTKRRAFIRGALPEAEVMRALAEPRIVSIDVLRPDLDASLREALKRALDPRPERRTVTAEEMVSTLRDIEPAAAGRQHLEQTLGHVRHEPKASGTSMPPPLADGVDPTTKLIPSMAAKPRAAATAAVPRVTAPYGSRPAAGNTPRPPVYASPAKSRSLEKEMPAATLSPEEVAVVMEQGAAAADPPLPASVTGLAELLEPSAPQRFRASGTGDAFARTLPGQALGVSIDEILAGSVAPTPMRAVTTSTRGALVGHEAATRKDAKTIQDTLEAGHTAPIGELLAAPLRPQAPAPPRVEPPAAAGTPMVPRPIPSSFPQMSRTLAMHERVDMSPSGSRELAPRGETPADAFQSTTVAMRLSPPRPVAPASSGTLLMEARPSVTPAPAPRLPTPRGSEPPAARRGSPLAIVSLLVLVVAACGVGMFGYARWKRTHAIAAAVPTGTAPGSGSGLVTNRDRAPTATVASTPVVVAVAGAEGTSSSDASVAASAIEDASPSRAVASASAASSANVPSPSLSSSSSPVVSAPPPGSAMSGDEIPSGMGRLKTMGTVPGRRIFVDERVVGQTPETALVKCGARKIRLGSAGFTRALEVPCGGELSVGDR